MENACTSYSAAVLYVFPKKHRMDLQICCNHGTLIDSIHYAQFFSFFLHKTVDPSVQQAGMFCLSPNRLFLCIHNTILVCQHQRKNPYDKLNPTLHFLYATAPIPFPDIKKYLKILFFKRIACILHTRCAVTPMTNEVLYLWLLH